MPSCTSQCPPGLCHFHLLHFNIIRQYTIEVHHQAVGLDALWAAGHIQMSHLAPDDHNTQSLDMMPSAEKPAAAMIVLRPTLYNSSSFQHGCNAGGSGRSFRNGYHDVQCEEQSNRVSLAIWLPQHISTWHGHLHLSCWHLKSDQQQNPDGRDTHLVIRCCRNWSSSE